MNLFALALLSTLCPKLSSLCLINCDPGDPTHGDPNSDAVYQSRQEYLAMAAAAHDAAQQFENMESLTVQSRCRRTYLSFIVERCPNLERLTLGAGCQVDDELVERAHAQHGLNKLKEFQCESADTLGLTVRTAAILLDACPRLSALGDLQRWRGLSAVEAAEVRRGCYEGNADVDTRSHQAIRQMLDMRGSDRRSQYHLMTGPAAERIRMAAERHRTTQT